MIQTSYVPLEHPYRIIEYNGTMGIQIGTLIVTRELRTSKKGYAIETHSHPVVSYVNNHAPKVKMKVRFNLINNPVEGVVWDKIDVNEVNTLVREDEEMKWSDFMDLCRSKIIKKFNDHYYNWVSEIAKTWNQLIDWGIRIQSPSSGEKGKIVLKVMLIDEFDGQQKYCAGIGDLGLITLPDDSYKMGDVLSGQIKIYKGLIKLFCHCEEIDVTFWTKNDRYEKLTEILNGEEKLKDDEESDNMCLAIENVQEPKPDIK